MSRTEGFIEISSGKIHYIEWDDGDKNGHILHPTGFCAGIYDPFVKYLQQDLHLVGTDVYGHGDSSPVPMNPVPHWSYFAENLREFIEKKFSSPVIGIGHSLGATITLIAAAKYPDLFSSLILMEPVLLVRRYIFLIRLLRILGLKHKFPLAKLSRRRKVSFKDKEDALSRFLSGRGAFKTWEKDFIKAYLDCGILVRDNEKAVLKACPEVEAQFFEAIPLDAWKYLPRLKCPVLVIKGDKSDTFLMGAANRTKRLIKNSKLVVIKDAGHFVPMEKPEETANIINKFVKDFI